MPIILAARQIIVKLIYVVLHLGLSIGIVFKNISSLNTPAYDMMQGTRRPFASPLSP
jgi:hypothetical protein